MHPLTSDAPLIVYIDVKSPYGFVALLATLALERELGVQFEWRPLTLDIPSYLGSAQKSKGQVVASSGRSERTWKAIKYSYMDARRYATRQGQILRGTEKIWNSRLINIAIMWVSETARDALPAFLTHVFPLFWNRDLDIEDLAVVEHCIEACGVSAKGFAGFADGEGGGEGEGEGEGGGGARHDALQPQLHPAGIYGVPTYVLDGEVFHGREHIPLIRWALSGREGPAPDIAYEIAASAIDESGAQEANSPPSFSPPTLDVYIDFKCAGSYLALDPTLALAERTGARIAWHPFSTAERDRPDEGADAGVIASHHATREASKRALDRKYAGLRGLELSFPDPARSADLALGVLEQLEGDPLPFIRACFAAYWESHADLDDPSVVAQVLGVSGGAHSGDFGTARESFGAAQLRAEEAGIVDAPGYRILGEIFVGRQHLPWIEELARQ